MRNQTVDIAKGIASLLVVTSHAIAYARWQGTLVDMAHLSAPLFFFLSGVFLHPQQPLLAAVRDKADGLLKPYAVVLLAFGLVPVIGSHLPVLPYLAGVAYGSGATIMQAPLWFLPHLFLAHLFCLGLVRLASACARPPWVLLLGAGLLLAAGQANITRFWHTPLPSHPLAHALLGAQQRWPGLPFSADLLPITAAYLLFGYVCRQAVQGFRVHPLALGLALAIIIGCLLEPALRLNLYLRVYRDLWVTTALAGATIYLALTLSLWSQRLPALAHALAYIGRRTLFILLFHLLIQRLVFNHFPGLAPDHLNALVPLAIVCGLAVPLVLLAITCRLPWLAYLLLPARARRFYAQDAR